MTLIIKSQFLLGKTSIWVNALCRFESDFADFGGKNTDNFRTKFGNSNHSE